MPDIKDTRRNTEQQGPTVAPTALFQQDRQPVGGVTTAADRGGPVNLEAKEPAKTEWQRGQVGDSLKPWEVNAATSEEKREVLQKDATPGDRQLHHGEGEKIPVIHPYGTGDGKHLPMAGDRDTNSKEYKFDAKAAHVGERVAGLGARAGAGITHAVHATGEAIKSAVGQLNAVDMLISQHRETESLIQRICDAKTFDPQSRHRLLETLCDSLIGHMRIEEEIFYPAMNEAGIRTSDKVLISEKEHYEAKELMTELLKLNPADSDFDDKLAKITKALRDHIKEEEAVLFPAAKEKIEDKKLKELGKQMHKRFSEIMKEKHPRYAAFQDVGKTPPNEETKQPAVKS